MRRREFIAALGGAAAWPLAARAQERVRRIGVLMFTTSDEPESQAHIAAFVQGLQKAGWEIGRNARLDVRWSSGSLPRLRQDAADLVALRPDVLVAGIGPTQQILQEATSDVPIVMTQTVDPIGTGVVKSLARPGGNITGFTQFEYSLSAKWLEMLREIQPRVARVGVIRERGVAVAVGQWAVIAAAAGPIGIEPSPIDVRMGEDIRSAIGEFARGPNDGLIVGVGTTVVIQRALLVELAARHKLPAVYPYQSFVEAGGLISYGPKLIDGYRRTAEYVDRILRGEKPGDLPVQVATRYDLAINLKTAKTLGITVPPSLLARADQVIE